MRKRQPKPKMPEAFSRYLLEGVRRIRDQAVQGQAQEATTTNKTAEKAGRWKPWVNK